MSDIKAGDLVMIVKLMPCCGNGKLGYSFTAMAVRSLRSTCGFCGHVYESNVLVGHPSYPERTGVLMSRLKKIDPPAEGDSLPTRANLDQPVTA